MKDCCNHSKKDKICRVKKRTFKLPRKFTKKQCIPYKKVKGFSKRSSCAPYKECKKSNKRYKKRSKRRKTKKKRE
jgi:hypothetical protein